MPDAAVVCGDAHRTQLAVGSIGEVVRVDAAAEARGRLEQDDLVLELQQLVSSRQAGGSAADDADALAAAAVSRP